MRICDCHIEQVGRLKEMTHRGGSGIHSPSQGPWDPDSLRPALSLGGQATAWECSPGPGNLFEGNPVDEGTTRRGTVTVVHRPETPAGSTHSSTRGLRPPESNWILLRLETCVRSLGWEDSLEKGKATHSSILACRIPWTA